MSDLDSTQTVRAVTTDELYDSHRQKWYAIQLVVSDRAVNLDMMPRLEVFVAHRLYAVVGKQGNVNQFALRLGFFRDPAEAQAICGNLMGYFSAPSIVRVSDAEQTRFAQSQAPRAPVQKPAAPRVHAAPTLPAARPAPATAEPPVAAKKLTKTAPPTPVRANGAQKIVKRARTLNEQLLEEAREVQLSRSGKHRMPQQSGSWISRLLGGAKR
ncbi:MAG TPA: hypothetical protein VGQ22_08120 [Steroidobacteraceae bacterium]|jgi:hypothetical protein|nr:hypothetical protein [Steroidobacteraceae bacterium]